ncbi:uncharacterized protein LOC128738297 [Sabethes cyaneus]|uniref:uncharacterized protein LOC128738297 n=1 Tax=Sabethes cyaneus TaxID=53552 RepID=UPI00237DD46E|nr:uncharacterized protein LOC128738297 [Sabethes cyaneus]
MHRKQSVSSRYSISTQKSPIAFRRRAKPSLPRLGKSHEGFNVDAGFETSEFDLIDFAEDVFNCQDPQPPKLIEEAAALFGLVAGTANRRRSTQNRIKILENTRRNVHPLHSGKYQKRRNRSQVSFDFDLSHDLVQQLQSSEDHCRKQSHHQIATVSKEKQHQVQLPAERNIQSNATNTIAKSNETSSRTMNWNKADAVKALLVETKAIELLKSPRALILRFPDPELNKDIVQSYSSSIENVVFHRPSTPRYCMVHLKPDADVERVIQQLSKISFGTGKITVERKTKYGQRKPTVKPNDIDPLTLFIGNLPNAVTVYTVKQMFPTARRIDIGHAQRLKHTRYAFIRFHSVNEAIAAFESNVNKVIDGKNIIIRFRRCNAPIALPEDTNTPKTPKRQKGASGQLFVSIEQKPRCDRTFQQRQGIHHSDTLNTIKTEILDEDCAKNNPFMKSKIKLEQQEVLHADVNHYDEEDDDDIEDFLEDDEDENVNLDEINTDANYCDDDDTDVDAFDKNFWTLEQLRNKTSADETSISASDSKESDIFIEPDSGTKTSSTTFNTHKPKEHKPVSTFIVSKRRDDQLQDLFSCLEPDDDLSL